MLSIGTTFNYEIPIKEQISLIKSAGFTHISLGGGDIEHSGYMEREKRKNLKSMTQDAGLKICSIHAPFNTGMDISSPNCVFSMNALDFLKRCVDACLHLDAEVLIFHPATLSPDNVEERQAVLVKRILSLMQYGRGENIRFACENMPDPTANRILTKSLGVIKNPKYGLCFDTCHDNLNPQPFSLLEEYGNRILTTHISDNRGQEDDHILPFEGNYDWKRFKKMFHSLNFKGIFLMEVEMRESSFKDPAEFLREAFLRGTRLMTAGETPDNPIQGL